VNFFNRDEVLLEKLMGRRICPHCNKGFNVAEINTEDGYMMTPLLPKYDVEYCDEHLDIPTKLIRRKDDREDIIMERLNLYKEKTLPILEYYHDHEHTVVIDLETKKGKADYPILK